MKTTHKILAVLLSAAILTGCGAASSESVSESAEGSSAVVTEKSLVTLGDSISAGYGLDDALSQRYSALLKDQLQARDNITWQDYNYAVSGDDSGDLVRNLNNGRALHAPSADTIILYIGANNLLGAYTDYFMNKAEENGFDLSDPENLTDEDITELQEKMEDEIEDADAVMESVQSIIDENLIQLDSDLETIYQWIRERNTKADIYVLNIYNPYTEDISSELIGQDTDFSEYAQSQIDRANEIIAGLIEKHDDLIPVDIASAFAACDPIPVLGSSIAEISDETDGTDSAEITDSADGTDNADTAISMEMEGYDPHPNADGQKLIADTIYQIMESRS